ncbi:hypothetical protein BST61_g3798 [Cercospora zeina]
MNELSPCFGTTRLHVLHAARYGLNATVITTAALRSYSNSTTVQATAITPSTTTAYGEAAPDRFSPASGTTVGAAQNASFFSAFPTSTYPIYHVTANTSVPGVDTALQCWSSIATWRNESASWWNDKIAGRTWTITSSYSSTTTFTHITTTYYPSNRSTYKLCDGSPRVNERPKTSHYSEPTTLFGSFTETLMPTFTPQPCSLNPIDCRIIYQDTNVEETDDRELLRQCGNPAHLGESPQCLLGGGPVELIYTPVEMKDNGSFCASNGTSPVTDRPLLPGPSAITTMGSTFSRDSVYISFKTLFASYDGFWDKMGPTFTDYIVPLHSTDISTQCGGWGQAYGPGTQLDYADLNWPVPASAYKCQDRCRMEKVVKPTLNRGKLGGLVSTTIAGPECDTIWSDINPMLAVPTKIREMVPEWATCSFWNENIANFWFDPPIALQPADVAATPTLPVAKTTTPAIPESTLVKPTAGQTTLASIVPSSGSDSSPESTIDNGLDVAPTSASSLVTKVVWSTVSFRLDPQTSTDTQYETPAAGVDSSNTGEPHTDLGSGPIIITSQDVDNTRSPTNGEVFAGATSPIRGEGVHPSQAKPADVALTPAPMSAPAPNQSLGGVMPSYTTRVHPQSETAAAAFSILTEALATFHSDAPDALHSLSSLSFPYVSWNAQPGATETHTKLTRPPAYNDPETSSVTMNSITAAAPTATPINGGVIPYLATIGKIIVLTGESYTLTAAIPSTNTDALAIIGATLSPGGPAASLGDYVFSLGTDGVQFVSGTATDTLRTSTSTTESSTEPTEPSSTSSAPATTSAEASAGQKQKVMWSVGGLGLLMAIIYAL